MSILPTFNGDDRERHQHTHRETGTYENCQCILLRKQSGGTGLAETCRVGQARGFLQAGIVLSDYRLNTSREFGTLQNNSVRYTVILRVSHL
jgi:hypothetical protein